MFNRYTCNAVTGSTGGYTMWQGLDLSQLGIECVLGETPMVDKDVKITGPKIRVGDMINTGDAALQKFDLMINMMLRENHITRSTMVRLGRNSRLLAMEIISKPGEKGEKGAEYRQWGKTYYGKKRTTR